MHCDVKPGNFCVIKRGSTRMFAVDLGTAQKLHACSASMPASVSLPHPLHALMSQRLLPGGAMRMPETLEQAKERISFFGTPDYASKSGLECLRCTFRDDLESLCYRCARSRFVLLI